MNRPLPLLLVEDDRVLREALAETLTLAGHEVLTASDGEAALRTLADTPVAGVVTDHQMKPMDGSTLLRAIRAERPCLPVLMITAHGTIEHAVRCMSEGATDYLVKPFAAPDLLDRLRQILPGRDPDTALVAVDPRSLELLEIVERVATSDATVLISGESGTGKEVIARRLHQRSARAKGPFVALNCAAIPENMLEALLFGHEKGAFTGAHESRPGKFEQARGGTLLLDEISEMDTGLQAKLLRVLQEREVERIGGRQPIPLDVRVIATTNRDLAAEVAAGRFREDLYYRLSVFPLAIPPLRQRPLDIEPLARHFLARGTAPERGTPALTDEALALLLAHDWPGNVRELHNLLQRAAILCNGNVIRPGDLRLTPAPSAIAGPAPAAVPALPGTGNDLHGSMASVEGQIITSALRRAGSRQAAAELLGVSPRTLRYRIARLREAGMPIPAARGETSRATL